MSILSSEKNNEFHIQYLQNETIRNPNLKHTKFLIQKYVGSKYVCAIKPVTRFHIVINI